MFVRPSVCYVQKRDDLPLDFLSFLSPSYRSVFARLLLFRIDDPSRFLRVHRMSLSCRASSNQETSDLFFYFALASSRLRESSIRRGRASQRDLFSFHAVHTRECVAGINQSTSPGIRVYGTPGARMTSRGSRDGARCAKITRCDFFVRALYFFFPSKLLFL